MNVLRMKMIVNNNASTVLDRTNVDVMKDVNLMKLQTLVKVN